MVVALHLRLPSELKVIQLLVDRQVVKDQLHLPHHQRQGHLVDATEEFDQVELLAACLELGLHLVAELNLVIHFGPYALASIHHHDPYRVVEDHSFPIEAFVEMGQVPFHHSCPSSVDHPSPCLSISTAVDTSPDQ
jgi:hypothetical protein